MSTGIHRYQHSFDVPGDGNEASSFTLERYAPQALRVPGSDAYSSIATRLGQGMQGMYARDGFSVGAGYLAQQAANKPGLSYVAVLANGLSSALDALLVYGHTAPVAKTPDILTVDVLEVLDTLTADELKALEDRGASTLACWSAGGAVLRCMMQDYPRATSVVLHGRQFAERGVPDTRSPGFFTALGFAVIEGKEWGDPGAMAVASCNVLQEQLGVICGTPAVIQ
jgi:hypothetical protein